MKHELQVEILKELMHQKAAASGRLKEVILGRNEPTLHHFHQNYREAQNEPPLEPVQSI